jgi:tetratricopeptide (TPR) repeat protein
MKIAKFAFLLALLSGLTFGNIFAQDFLQTGIDKITQKDYKGAIENLKKAVEKTPKVSNAYFFLAEAYFLSGEMDNSEANLKKAIEYDDENAKAIKRSGDILFLKGSFREALNRYNQAVKLEKKNPDFLLAQGKAMIEIDSIDQAVNKISLAIEISPNNPELYIARGNAYLKMGVPPMAIDNLKKASELDSNNAEAHIRLGDIYMSGKLKMYREAINEYIRAVEIDSANEKILGKVAHLLFYNATLKNGLYARAANYYRKYTKLVDTSYQAFWEYGTALSKINPPQFDLSIEMLKKSLKLRKNPVEGLRSLAISYFFTQNWKEVTSTYIELEKLDSLSADEYLKMGRAHKSLKDTIAAISAFEKGFKADSTSMDLIGDLANSYILMKKYEEAVTFLRKRFNNDTTTNGKTKLWNQIGLCMLQAKNYDGAREAYLNLIDLNPEEPKYHYYIAAYVFEKYGKNDSIKLQIDHYKKVIELSEGKENEYKIELASAYYIIAINDYSQKNYQKSLDGFTKSLKYDIKNQGSMLYIAYCYAALNQKEDACKACDRLLKINAKHKDVLELKKKLGCWVYE